jgi:hypothetical protein
MPAMPPLETLPAKNVLLRNFDIVTTCGEAFHVLLLWSQSFLKWGRWSYNICEYSMHCNFWGPIISTINATLEGYSTSSLGFLGPFILLTLPLHS